MNDNIEEKFLEISSKTVENSKKRIKDGNEDVREAFDKKSEFEPQTMLNMAGEEYAFASEIAMKSNIIFDDFRKNYRFNQTNDQKVNINGKEIECYKVGTDNWYKSLAAENRNLKILGDPKEIRKLILENNPNDERAKINNEPIYNSQFLSLSYDGEKPSGHSLYAFYQLLPSAIKALINMEYYCYVEDEDKYTIYAILTDDILTKNNNGKTIMPQDMMEKLDSVKESSVKLRYSSISQENINSDKLKFLKEFSNSIETASEYRFPLPKSYKKLDFQKFNYQNFAYKGYQIFNSLDKMTKYYLQSSFSKKELQSFMNYIELLKKQNPNVTYLNTFINTCIYLKYYSKNNYGDCIDFTERVFGRIDNLCELIKAFQPFDPNQKKLIDNPSIFTKENIKRYKSEIIQKKEEKETIEKLEKKAGGFSNITIDESMKKRFSHYNNKTIEELKKIRKEEIEELEYSLKILESETASSSQKYEIRNMDLRFTRETIAYINHLINKKTNYEEIAKKLEQLKLGQAEELLKSIGRKQHIEYETGESEKLVQENPERFFKIGSRTISKENMNKNKEKYEKDCIENAKYLYECCPIIFEFYDELMNGITQQNVSKSKEQEEKTNNNIVRYY